MMVNGARRAGVSHWLVAVATLVAIGVPAFGSAAVITLNTDPFAGSTALTTPGRQVVANELFSSFDPAVDTILIDLAAYAPYGFGPTVSFVNDVITGVPTGGANVIVLRTFDNDNDPATPFAAGNAANLIAAQVTTPGAGFFIYFNQGLNVPRLVFSTDLNDPTADLKILVRFTNLTGTAGQAALATFTANDFQVSAVPEPSLSLLLAAGGLSGLWHRYRRYKARLR